MRDFKLGDRVKLDRNNGWFDPDRYPLEDFVVVDRHGKGLSIDEQEAELFSSYSQSVSVAPISNLSHALWIRREFVHLYNPIWCE